MRRDTEPALHMARMARQEHTVPVIGAEFDRVLAEAQAGDEASFALLWRDVNPPLLRYLSIGGDVAEEVAAETWATVVKGLRSFVGDESAWRAWVFTTARRRAVDAGRKRAREAGLGWRASTWASDHAEDCADVVVELTSTEDALRLVRRLPALQAEVVLLRIVGGLPVAEVAAITGRTPGAVRVACHRGLQTLSSWVGPEGPGRGVTTTDATALRG
jgi:RNA polymerase sigma-70 factor (ECF subfamily)